MALIDSFTVPLRCPNARHLPTVRAVQRDCHWGLKNSGNSHWSHEPIMQWGTRQSQSIFRPTNPKRVLPANWRPCFISHWQPYCHQVRTVYQSRALMFVVRLSQQPMANTCSREIRHDTTHIRWIGSCNIPNLQHNDVCYVPAVTHWPLGDLNKILDK